MSFAAIYLPEFPAAAWLRGAPQLGSQPLAVIEGAPPQERVVSLNRRAKVAGIAHGMSRVQAEATCAAVFHARQLEEEQAAFATAIEVVERFSPRVQAIASPANSYGGDQRLAVSLILDSSGIGTLFGTIESYARKLHGELAAAGFPAGIGMAPNAEAALLLARSGSRVICADLSGLRAKLAPLSTSLLPCEPKVRALLARWGIRTLGELAALPEAALISRMGQQAQRLQQLARGEAEHLLVPEEPAFTLAETVALDAPLELLDSLFFVLSPMLEKILRRALERALALRTVRLTLELERGDPHTVEVRPALPAQNRELLLKLLRLELQARPPQAGILGVTVEAEPTRPQVGQHGLFQTQFPEPGNLDLLLARLRRIAGDGNIGSPKLRNSYREDAFTLAPFQPGARATATGHQPPSRLAIRMFRPPEPVRVVFEGSRPRVLFWQSAHFSIASSAGPWHTSGSWWDGEAWDGELWDVATSEPVQALRLEHTAKGWFVVGLYD